MWRAAKRRTPGATCSARSSHGEAKMPRMHRRQLLQSAALAGLAGVVAGRSSVSAEAAPPAIKPKRLSPGDTVVLVSPASATFNSVDLQIAKESLEALGFKVRAGEHMLERHGYLAGEDKARADDINKAFA